MDPIPLPPPFRGQKDDIPLVLVESPYARYVKNFNLDDGSAKLRKGDTAWATKTGKTILGLATYGFGSSQKMFAVHSDGGGVGIKFSDASSGGALTDAYAPGGSGSDDEIHTLFFNNVLTFFGEGSLKPASVGCPTYNGSAWGLSGYTYPTMGNPFGGCAFKNRAYILERNSTKYAYSAINAISGATTEVDLAQVISTNGYLYGIRSISLSEGIEQENILCFIFNTGEVLAYAGSYPNSSDWRLVGRFVIGNPIYYNAFVDVNGDSFVITKTALVSLRSLFTQGTEVALTQSISDVITNRWKEVIGFDWETYGANQIYIKGIFDQERNRIVITLPLWIGSEPGYDSGTPDSSYCHRMIYSFDTKSWFEHVTYIPGGAGLTSATYFKGNLYYGTYGGVMKAEGASDYTDDQLGSTDVTYNYQLESAPISAGRAYVAKAEGLDVLMTTDLASQTNYQFIADLGVTTSTAQKVPSGTTSMQKTFVNMGIEGSYIQYKISGSTTSGKTVGLNIYGLNVWTQSGQSPR